MYLPKVYKSEDFEVLKEIIANNAFASLLVHQGKILATKSMMLVNEDTPDNFYIETHLHRANPVAKCIVQSDQEVLCDFTGASSYISSSWYDHVNVSTWNYEAVQVYGKVEIMNDEELYQHLVKMTHKFESTQKCPVLADTIGEASIRDEMRGAIGMKIIPTEVKIKQKLSQNRDEKNLKKIIETLEKSESSSDNTMAERMKKYHL